jgi:RNA polymerase sigma-70 factor (ECF subfamily)
MVPRHIHRWKSWISLNYSRRRAVPLVPADDGQSISGQRPRPRPGGQARRRTRHRPLDPQDAEDRFTQEPAITETPEIIFERRWALAVLDEALNRLRAAAGAADKARHFEQLQSFLSREPDEGEYATLAAPLELSAGAVGVAVHRLRQRYRETLRATVADTLSDPAQVDQELRHVLAALRGDSL